ncbi:hypothetical protein CGMCC3_g7012 [Colletotrichum fructicola]|nr:uncharacterized protein CGMCC3_g7012 [Colletotrichum fructicola]KAE9576817.1 hypothetical protein CGMCC3_g7012 [Colletotrichum fructicola]
MVSPIPTVWTLGRLVGSWPPGIFSLSLFTCTPTPPPPSPADTLRQAVALPLLPLHGAVILTAVPNSPCHARLGYGKGARA